MWIELTDGEDVKQLYNLDLVRRVAPIDPDDSGDTKTKTEIYWIGTGEPAEVQEDYTTIKGRLNMTNAIVP